LQINPNWELVMATARKHSSFDVMGLLTQHNTRWTSSNYQEDQIVYAQGDPADSVFYIHRGKVKVTVVSKLGKEAVVAIRGPDEFCGEGALTGKPLRLATTTTMSTCEIIRLESKIVVRLLHENQEFADYFLAHLLTRTARVEADLVDQLFNSSEMRLARALLLLANYGTTLAWSRYRKGESGDACRADWNDPVSRECFHEQISEVGLDQLQRQAGSSKRPC
jgi:CRP/FNR family cyclic AMP-dependent transcriptional regulator